ncbi:MAG: hypothetical protein BGO43_07215 [Gammaproteobacteria bacterium 39-13]|nr:hypothetical protein [Gammaproteobacteria bacterium]OJV88376.1 MAG: hypothetical protein BGO43_07215 [Gammaproteobacteria bacterium 39-13]
MKKLTALNKKTVKILAIATVFLSPALAQADSCPLAKEAMDHATKEGIGAQWQTGGKLNWYLDYFSNNNKPPETAAAKFTFMQASFENDQLTCYYQWPNDDGKTTNWMTVRLRTTEKIKASWTGKVCQNFEAMNCQFTFGNGAPSVGTTPVAPALGTQPAAAVPGGATQAPPPPPTGAQTLPPPPTGTQTPPPAPGDEQLPKAPGDLVVPKP